MRRPFPSYHHGEIRHTEEYGVVLGIAEARGTARAMQTEQGLQARHGLAFVTAAKDMEETAAPGPGTAAALDGGEQGAGSAPCSTAKGSTNSRRAERAATSSGRPVRWASSSTDICEKPRTGTPVSAAAAWRSANKSA